jgi:hypothetical protein
MHHTAVDEMKEALEQAATPALKAMGQAVALVRAHPYASAATLVALAGGWYVYETYVHGPAHRKQRQLEKRRARVNVDSALGLGFKSCPEVNPPSIIYLRIYTPLFILCFFSNKVLCVLTTWRSGWCPLPFIIEIQIRVASSFLFLMNDQ